MFDLETEDQLPRAAPKPNTTSLTEDALKPTVPEVSLIYGQQQQQQKQNKAPTVQPSYAQWKKQVLPKVIYPPGIDNSNAPFQAVTTTSEYFARSNLYPFRAATSVAPIETAIPSSSNTNNMRNYEAFNRRGIDAMPYYTSVQPAVSATTALSSRCSDQGFYSNSRPTSTDVIQQRRSLDIVSNSYDSPRSYSSNQQLQQREVLTICAGTQTDATLSPTSSNNSMVAKQDFERLCSTVEQLRQTQERILQICETLMLTQQQQKLMPLASNPNVNSLGIQCELFANVPELLNGYAEMPTEKLHLQTQQQQMESNYFNGDPTLCQTPRNAPAAQSTAYQPNTPKQLPRVTFKQQPVYQQQPAQQLQQQQQNQLQQQIQFKNLQLQQAEQQNRLLQQQVQVQQFQTQQSPQQQMIDALLQKPTTEKSMLMNELALKYLPNEKLNELLQELQIKPPIPSPNVGATNPSTPLANTDSNDKCATDLSNASYKYLLKYRLVADTEKDNIDSDYDVCNVYEEQNGTPRVKTPLTAHRQQHNSPYDCIVSPSSSPANALQQEEEHMLDLENIRRKPKFL